MMLKFVLIKTSLRCCYGHSFTTDHINKSRPAPAPYGLVLASLILSLP